MASRLRPMMARAFRLRSFRVARRASCLVGAVSFVCYCQSAQEKARNSKVPSAENDLKTKHLQTSCGWSLDAVSSLVTQSYLEFSSAHQAYRDSIREAMSWMKASEYAVLEGENELIDRVSDKVIEARLAVEETRKEVRNAELLMEFAKKALQAVGETAFLANAVQVSTMAGERLVSYDSKEGEERLSTSEAEESYLLAQEQHILSTIPSTPVAGAGKAAESDIRPELEPQDPAAVLFEESYFNLAELFFL